MQPRFAAILPRPAGLWTDQADAGAVAVIMHAPFGGEDRCDVIVGEEIGRAVRAIEHADGPIGAKRGWRYCAGDWHCDQCLLRQMQRVAREQTASAVAAKFAQIEGAAAAKIRWHIEPACEQDITAHAAASDAPRGEHLPCTHRDGGIAGDCRAIERGGKICAGEADCGGRIELDGRASCGHLQPGNAGIIAQQPVAQPEGARIHRAGWGDADIPQPGSARKILHRGCSAAGADGDAVRMVGDAFERAGGYVARNEISAAHHIAQPAQIGLNPRQPRFIQRCLHRGDGFGAGFAAHDQLAQHRIIKRRDRSAALNPGFDPRICGKMRLGQSARGRAEIERRVFGIEPRLHRPAFGSGSRRIKERGVARRAAHHPFDQINAGHFLGNAVLHLQPGVHLKEEPVLPRRIIEELDRARRAIVRRRAKAHRRFDQFGADMNGQMGGGSLFNHFLIAPLERAIALTQRHYTARAISKNLHLDMPRARHEAFKKQPRIAEIARAEPRHGGKAFAHGGFISANAHADPAAARCGFEHHWKADPRGLGYRSLGIGQQASARRERDAVGLRECARAVLQPKGAHVIRRGADEGDPGGLASFGKSGVF